MARLTKRDVERLLERYDTDPAGAVADALTVVLGRSGTWTELVTAAVDDPVRRARLLDRDVDALDGLVRELNELRGLDR